MTTLFSIIKSGQSAEALNLIQKSSAAGGGSGSSVDLNERGKDGPEPNGDGGATVLIAAIKNFDISNEVVFALLEAGADPNLPDTLDQETPIMAATRTYPYDPTLVQALLAKGARMDIVNKHGDSALHVAASSSAANIAAYMISKGANYKAKDRKGKTPLEIAPDVATQSSIEEAIALLS
jgi:ankyrin repeat protein